MSTFKELEQQAVNGFANIKREALEIGNKYLHAIWFTPPVIMAQVKMKDYDPTAEPQDFKTAADYGLAALNSYAIPDFASKAHVVAYFRKNIEEDFKRYKAIMAEQISLATADTQKDENAPENGAEGAENGDN